MIFGLSYSPLYVQDGETALYNASSNGQGQIVEFLLRREANVNHQTRVSLFVLVCMCSFTRSVIFFNVKYTCIYNHEMSSYDNRLGYKHQYII